MQSRLESEYNVETTVTTLPYKLARWIDRDVHDVAKLNLPSRSKICIDSAGKAVVLFSSQWELDYAEKENPDVTFLLAA